MSNPYVTSATIKHGKITLSVQVTDFTPGEWVEISGQATQTNGAFANFYDIQQIPAKPKGEDDNYIAVTGAPTPHQFSKDLDVSVVARVSRVWLTILGGRSQPSQRSSDVGQMADEGWEWKEKGYSQINGGALTYPATSEESSS